MPNIAHLSSSVPNIAHLSSSVPNIAHLSSSVPNIAQFSSSVPNIAQLSSSVPNIAQLSSSVPNIAHLSSSVPNIAHLGPEHLVDLPEQCQLAQRWTGGIQPGWRNEGQFDFHGPLQRLSSWEGMASRKGSAHGEGQLKQERLGGANRQSRHIAMCLLEPSAYNGG